MAIYRTPANQVAEFADMAEAYADAKRRGLDYCVTGTVSGNWAVRRMSLVEVNPRDVREGDGNSRQTAERLIAERDALRRTMLTII